MGDAGPVDGHWGGRGGQAALRRGAAEGRHDGLRHLADEALVARGAQEHGARLAAEAAQGPEVHPPDRLRGQRLEPGLDCGGGGGAASGGPAEGGDVGQLAGVPGPGCRGPGAAVSCSCVLAPSCLQRWEWRSWRLEVDLPSLLLLPRLEPGPGAALSV